MCISIVHYLLLNLSFITHYDVGFAEIRLLLRVCVLVMCLIFILLFFLWVCVPLGVGSLLP